MPSHILRLDPQGARLYVCNRHGARAAQDFADAPTCGAWLAARARLRLWLLADFAEEAFVLESLPRLGINDRRALIARKLARQFPETPYRAACSLGRAPDRPEQDACLLLALTRPALLDPWLAALHAAGTQIDGLTSAAQLAAPFMQRLALPGTHALLVSGDAGNVRQSLVRLGARPLTLFSRRTLWPAPLDATVASSPASSRADEIAADLLRLRAQLEQGRFLPRGVPLPTVLALPTALGEALGAQLARHPDFQLAASESSRMAKRLGCADTDLQPLFVHHLARRPPRLSLLPASARAARTLAFRQRLWRLAAGVGSLAGLLAGALELENAATARTAAQRHADASARLEAALARETPAQQAPLGSDAAHELCATADWIARQTATPGPLLQALGRALAETPDMRLSRLDWQNGATSPELEVRLRGPAESLVTPEVPAELRAALARAGLSLLPAADLARDAPLQGGDAGPDERGAQREWRLRLQARRAGEST